MLHYGLEDDWRPLGDVARGIDAGFVDLLSASSRAQLASSTVIGQEQARSYHYGIITWALPIKVKATVSMSDGSSLYTHDGVNTFGAREVRAVVVRARGSL